MDEYEEVSKLAIVGHPNCGLKRKKNKKNFVWTD
jgi:hypothetical protein